MGLGIKQHAINAAIPLSVMFGHIGMNLVEVVGVYRILVELQLQSTPIILGVDDERPCTQGEHNVCLHDGQYAHVAVVAAA